MSRSSQLWGCASCLATCLSAVAIMPAFGSDAASFEALVPVPRPVHRLVLRISDAVLASYLGREIEQQVPVRDVILGTAVTGTAHISGEPSVKLLERSDGAAFHLEVRGTAVSRTIGRNGPAIIHSRSVTHFTATKQIVYKAGRGFSGSPGEVTARTQSFTEGIGSTRGGLIGRIVHRKAAEQIAENNALTTEIARQKAQRQIAAAFDRHMDERIAHLNQMVESQSLWASLVGGSGRMPYACCSTQGHLQIAAAHPRESRPIALPVRGPASATAAPFELWVHNSLLPEPTPGLLTRLSQTSAASDVLNACIGPAALIKKQSLEAAINGLTRNFDWQKIGDWVVVEVLPSDQPDLVRTAAAPAGLR